jgi:hypothetical protein
MKILDSEGLSYLVARLMNTIYTAGASLSGKLDVTHAFGTYGTGEYSWLAAGANDPGLQLRMYKNSAVARFRAVLKTNDGLAQAYATNADGTRYASMDCAPATVGAKLGVGDPVIANGLTASLAVTEDANRPLYTNTFNGNALTAEPVALLSDIPEGGGGDSIVIDAAPTEGSGNAVSSGGVFEALQDITLGDADYSGKVDASHDFGDGTTAEIGYGTSDDSLDAIMLTTTDGTYTGDLTLEHDMARLRARGPSSNLGTVGRGVFVAENGYVSMYLREDATGGRKKDITISPDHSRPYWSNGFDGNTSELALLSDIPSDGGGGGGITAVDSLPASPTAGTLVYLTQDAQWGTPGKLSQALTGTEDTGYTANVEIYPTPATPASTVTTLGYAGASDGSYFLEWPGFPGVGTRVRMGNTGSNVFTDWFNQLSITSGKPFILFCPDPVAWYTAAGSGATTNIYLWFNANVTIQGYSFSTSYTYSAATPWVELPVNTHSSWANKISTYTTAAGTAIAAPPLRMLLQLNAAASSITDGIFDLLQTGVTYFDAYSLRYFDGLDWH